MISISVQERNKIVYRKSFEINKFYEFECLKMGVKKSFTK